MSQPPVTTSDQIQSRIAQLAHSLCISRDVMQAIGQELDYEDNPKAFNDLLNAQVAWRDFDSAASDLLERLGGESRPSLGHLVSPESRSPGDYAPSKTPYPPISDILSRIKI